MSSYNNTDNYDNSNRTTGEYNSNTTGTGAYGAGNQSGLGGDRISSNPVGSGYAQGGQTNTYGQTEPGYGGVHSGPGSHEHGEYGHDGKKKEPLMEKIKDKVVPGHDDKPDNYNSSNQHGQTHLAGGGGAYDNNRTGEYSSGGGVRDGTLSGSDNYGSSTTGQHGLSSTGQHGAGSGYGTSNTETYGVTGGANPAHGGTYGSSTGIGASTGAYSTGEHSTTGGAYSTGDGNYRDQTATGAHSSHEHGEYDAHGEKKKESLMDKIKDKVSGHKEKKEEERAHERATDNNLNSNPNY